MGPDLSALRAYIERLIDEIANLKTAIREPGPLPSPDRAEMLEHLKTVSAAFSKAQVVLRRAEDYSANRGQYARA